MKTHSSFQFLLIFLLSGLTLQTFAQTPVADFSWSFPQLPYKAQFVDQSTNNPTIWNWSFGDSTGSVAQNPIKTYTVNGNYTVCLTACNGNGCSSPVCKNVSITGVGAMVLVLLPANACTGSTLALDAWVNNGYAPYSYTWSGTGNALNCTNCAHPQTVLTQNSTYSVTVVDAYNNSATASAAYTLNGFTNNMSISATNTGIDCLHHTDTTVVSITGGVPNYNTSWGDSWHDGFTTHNFQSGGVYPISVTDTNGCIASMLDTVPYHGIVLNALQQIHPQCEGMNTGKIKVAASGGTGPYNFFWSNAATADSIVNIRAGSYNVTVSDAVSCTAAYTYNLGPVDGWWYVYMGTSPSNCNNNGTINTLISGGTPPFVINWSNGATTQVITGLTGGVYNLTVSDASGCSTSGNATVSSECFSVITGTIYSDNNNNCTIDNGEGYSYSGYVIAHINGLQYYSNIDADGYYSVLVPSTGTYTLSLWQSSGHCGNLSTCDTNDVQVTVTTLGDTSANHNFGVQNTTGFDLYVHPGWMSANPGFTKEYWIYGGNDVTTPFTGNATLTFKYDPNLIFQSATPGAVHDFDTHTLTWTFAGISGFSGPRCNFLVPVALPLGQLLDNTFRLTPLTGDCDTFNNTLIVTEVVTGSHDPNSKEVSPVSQLTESDSVLTYTINFQNSGTDSTHFVIVKDTLSQYLDPATVQNLASSHPYQEFTLSGKGILTWVFNPLRLVDSATNEQGSKGFVKFSVRTKNNLAGGTVISNHASIYFDYNEPVPTNTVSNTIATPNAIVNVQQGALKVYPNPASGVLNIEFDGTEQGRIKLRLDNIFGQTVSEQTHEGLEGRNIITLPVNQLSTGVYFISLQNEKGQLTAAKFVKE